MRCAGATVAKLSDYVFELDNGSMASRSRVNPSRDNTIRLLSKTDLPHEARGGFLLDGIGQMSQITFR
jgi:hypothetical protein